MSRNQKADKKQLLLRLEKTPIVEVACQQAKVPRSTYYRWRKADKAFAEACDEALEESIGRINDLAESQLISAIKEQNMGAITFWLKHHHKRYTTRVELTARTDQDEALTPEQAATVRAALQLAGLLSNEVSLKDINE
ncbi:MAG TPA: phBC6A51 family helix-turn-helix protein [Candidatus Saccharimonadales bacterium]|jgi:hypothetical protein